MTITKEAWFIEREEEKKTIVWPFFLFATPHKSAYALYVGLISKESDTKHCFNKPVKRTKNSLSEFALVILPIGNRAITDKGGKVTVQ